MAYLPVLLAHLVHCFDDQLCSQETILIQRETGIYQPESRNHLCSVKTLPAEASSVKCQADSGMPQNLSGPRFTDAKHIFKYQAIDLQF